MYFQDVILGLQKFWAKKGCVLVQPYDMEVGAGTFHPATLLKALGPEPWNVAYVQPSRRPTDGRYGENPNRLQHYYQYQVVLKPSPTDIQELYLNSLRALGVDPLVHDIRFHRAVAAAIRPVFPKNSRREETCFVVSLMANLLLGVRLAERYGRKPASSCRTLGTLVALATTA